MSEAELKPVAGLTRAQLAACQRLYSDWCLGNRRAAGTPTPEQRDAILGYRQALLAVGRQPAALLVDVLLVGRPHREIAAELRCRPIDIARALQVVASHLAAHYSAIDGAAAAAA